MGKTICLAIGTAAMVVAVAGCQPDTPDLAVVQMPVTAVCTAQVDGIGAVDVESDYVPHVVACENGNADFEALKAQAVAARSVLYHTMGAHGSIGDGQHAQVYSCARAPSQAHYDAAAATAGQVLTYNGNIVYAFYVSGAIPSSSGCVAQAGDNDPHGVEHYVTYNWNNSGASVEQTNLGWVNAQNWANRGCKSQNGAHCLAGQGWGYRDILKFYYGMDIGFDSGTGACVPDDPGGDDPGGDDPGQSGNGTLKGVVFADTGVGTSDMSIRIDSATVSISGQASQAVQPGGALFEQSLPAGSYTVVASASGYADASRTCTVTAGADSWCSVGLFAGDENQNPGGDDPGGDDPPVDDPGGDDPVDDPNDGDPNGDGDAHGDFDFEAPKGHVYGYAIALTSEADFENCSGPTVPGAKIKAETGEETDADGDGHFEFWAVPGDHLLAAEAEGFMAGAAECKVVSEQSVFCCLPLKPEEADAELGPVHQEEDPNAFTCASAGTRRGLALLPGLLLLAALRRRRA